MCGLSSASQKRRNGRNARLKTLNCGRHDVRGRWRRSVDDPHPNPCYALYRPLRAAPSAMHRQIGRIEKAHLHVRFAASMRETQKRLQRTPQK